LSTVTARYLKASDNSVVKELFFQILNAAWMNETNWNKKKILVKNFSKNALKKISKMIKEFWKWKWIMQDQKIPIFWIKKKSQTQQRKIPILRCRYTAANYTIDVSFENVLTENTRIIHIKYVHLNCCIALYFTLQI